MSNQHSFLLSHARALLSANGAMWNTVSGRLRNWEGGAFLDDRRARSYQKSEAAGRGELKEPVSEYGVWCVRKQWRIRLDLEWEQPWEPDLGISPTTTVIDGRLWWSITDGVPGSLMTGMMPPDVVFQALGLRVAIYRGEVIPNPGKDWSRPGTENLTTLIEPGKLPTAFTFRHAQFEEIEGRPSIRVSAVPLPGDTFPLGAEGLTVLGAEEYSLAIDVASGVLVAWEAYVDGRPTLAQTLTALRVDEPIAGELFIPPRNEHA
jgi:hypothetical protein